MISIPHIIPPMFRHDMFSHMIKDKKIFYFFRESKERDKALKYKAGGNGNSNLDRLFLFGYDDLLREGVNVECNLNNEKINIINWFVCKVFERYCKIFHPQLNGRWSAIARGLSRARKADIIYGFTDGMALPLLMLKSAGLLKADIIYVSVGLPVRIDKLDKGSLKLVRKIFSHAKYVVAYGYGESRYLQDLFEREAIDTPVHFVPFGVDVEQWTPGDNDNYEYDAICVGEDPNRDIECFFKLANTYPEKIFVWITRDSIAANWPDVPDNVKQFREIDIHHARELMLKSRVIALPLKNNSYSGANITILLSMAMGKPVVVSNTDAIKSGYGLENGENCILVEPGKCEEFIDQVGNLISNRAMQISLGQNARSLVTGMHTWPRFVNDLTKNL